jgi:hypothetical protein
MWRLIDLSAGSKFTYVGQRRVRGGRGFLDPRSALATYGISAHETGKRENILRQRMSPVILFCGFECLNSLPYLQPGVTKQITRGSGLLKWIFSFFGQPRQPFFISRVPFSFFWILVSDSGLRDYISKKRARLLAYSKFLIFKTISLDRKSRDLNM